jgi:hypothetical protein
MFHSVCERDQAALMRGDRHVAVQTIQDALNKRGASPRLAVDGDFGKHTESATTKFQIANMGMDGVTGGVMCGVTMRALGVGMRVQEQISRAPVHQDTADWQSKLKYDRISLGSVVIDPITGQYTAAVGLGWRLDGYKSLVGGRIENKNHVWIFHGPDDPDRSAAGKNECALLVQGFGCGPTSQWRRGPQVRACDHIPSGTVIATLRDGVYYSDHSGRSHVGIFDSFVYGKDGKKTGFRMYDQSNGSNIGLSNYKFYDSYDRDAMVEKPKGKNGDLTIPVYDDNKKLLGFTVIEDDFYKTNKYRWISVGDEYYVMYNNGKSNLVML